MNRTSQVWSDTAKTHICLVSDDPLPMLTPIIDEKIPSDRLLLVFFEQDEILALNAKKIANQREYDCELLKINQHANIDEIKTLLTKCFDSQIESDVEVWLNATSTHLHLSLAAFEVARAYNAPAFVVEPRLDALYWLNPESWPNQMIHDHLSINEYFALKSIAISKTNPFVYSSSLKTLASVWANNAKRLHGSLSTLNYLANRTSGESLTSVAMTKQHLSNDSLQLLVDELLRANAIIYAKKRITFADNNARFFAGGGWLELAVTTHLQNIKKDNNKIQDIALGVEVEVELENAQSSKAIKNELDNVVLANNKLHVIECKTAKMKDNQTDVLYKLDSLRRRLGSKRARCCLITFFPLKRHEYLRAQISSIHVICLAEDSDWKQSLTTWLNQA